MIKIIDTRGTGKTGRLMLLAKEHTGVIVCDDVKSYCERMYRYGLTGIDFVTYQEYFMNIRKFDNQAVFIDDMSRFLATCFREQIKGYTESTD